MIENNKDLENQKEYEEQKTEIQKVELELKKNLTGADDTKVQELLREWMRDVNWGSDYEARRLIIFIKIWYKTLRAKNLNTRFIKEKAIQCAIFKQIEIHFSGLCENKKSPSYPSMTLLNFALYGIVPDTAPNKIERIKDQISNDAIYKIKYGTVPTVSEGAEHIGVDRKTIRDDRKTSEYKEGLKTSFDFLSFINSREK